MKTLTTFLIALILVSCKKTIAENDLQLLNGYWEIEKAITADKSVKEYPVNTTYDYLEINGLQGFRKKVYPQLLGNYQTNDDSESFTISKQKKSWTITYKNNENQWVETLQSLSENKFVVTNEAGIEYHYKKVKN